LCVIGLAVSTALAQAPGAVAPAAPATAAAVVSPAAPVVAAGATATAQEITIKGKVSVVNNPDGTLKLIFINPPAPEHGYKVDLVNGEGKSLADKHGKIVEASGVDANRLFTIKTITVVE